MNGKRCRWMWFQVLEYANLMLYHPLDGTDAKIGGTKLSAWARAFRDDNVIQYDDSKFSLCEIISKTD